MTGMNQGAVTRARVVLADDDEDWRDLLAGSLELAGYEVSQAADGLELRNLLEVLAARGSVPDLVVSDHRMPHATGLEVLAWTRERTPEVPFILLSAMAAPQIREPALELGAVAVFAKPVDIKFLLAQVGEILERKASSH